MILIDENLLRLVRCPIDGQQLMAAPQQLSQALNERIDQGTLRDHVDAPVQERTDGALVTLNGERAYPVREGIPTLIPAEAIVVPQELRELVQRVGPDSTAGGR